MKIPLGLTVLGSFAALGILIASAQAGDSCERAKAEHDTTWKEYDAKDKSNFEPGAEGNARRQRAAETAALRKGCEPGGFYDQLDEALRHVQAECKAHPHRAGC